MYPAIYAQTHPDKPASIMASTGEVMTYRQLNAGSNLHSAPLGWRSTYFPRGIFRTPRTPQQW